MAKRKRTKRRQDETVFYVVEITNREWGYSFGVNNVRHFDDPYLEFRHLNVRGKLLRPGGIKAETVELTFMPDKKLNEENRQHHEPKAVGSLSLNKGVLQGLLPLPADALEPILQMLTADRFRYVVMDGTKLRYRQGLVRDFRLSETLDEDDLPPEDG